MTKEYFTVDEDYKEIITKALKEDYDDVEITDLHNITTGWTNIVYEVATSKGNFFFRFPRDQFWERTIVKDYEFAKYINGKTSFKTVDLKLKENEGRPFSMHQKIYGTPLASKMDDMSQEEVKKVSGQIAKFMYEMHSLDYKPEDIFSINNIGLDIQDFISELLSAHVSKEDNEFWYNYNLIEKSEPNVLVHGDLNSSNILLDDDNNISAVIDFGFGGFGNKYCDISRIIGRCNDRFKPEIIKSYEELENKKLNMNMLDDKISVWSNIDTGYINYMRKIGIYK